ncbi:PREDICTED: uncharacterized protein LOC106808746 [Priapulus caudatus]|uniref:Uncharacterized protein LOC106808746 n=1 Tax=Priapulus caudatus TaxID=37621 RepID=A0ABM1E4F3_PRICU|nr:PREDICTED: uncharacterized protein LOC106808746 [Priapulus caudatus]
MHASMTTILVALTMHVTGGLPWDVDEYPNPQQDPIGCARSGERSTWVCDPDRLLAIDEANLLDRQITKVKNHTGCPCDDSCTGPGGRHHRGFAIAVALAEKIIRGKGEHETEIFVENLRKLWHIGLCGEDIVIFFNEQRDEGFSPAFLG